MLVSVAVGSNVHIEMCLLLAFFDVVAVGVDCVVSRTVTQLLTRGFIVTGVSNWFGRI